MNHLKKLIFSFALINISTALVAPPSYGKENFNSVFGTNKIQRDAVKSLKELKRIKFNKVGQPKYIEARLGLVDLQNPDLFLAQFKARFSKLYNIDDNYDFAFSTVVNKSCGGGGFPL